MPTPALTLPPLFLICERVRTSPRRAHARPREAGGAWLRALRAHCDAEGALLIYDEVYTGFGRTGEWFAFEAVADDHEGPPPLPDLICLGKAMAGGFLAVGAFVSALTKNQVIAFVVTAAICFLFIAFGTSVVLNALTEWAPGWTIDFVRSLSFTDHYSAIARGKLDLRDVVYFVSVIVLFLFLNGVVVERSKASS